MIFRFDNPIAIRRTKTVFVEDGKTVKLFVINYPSSKVLNEAINLAKVEEATDLKLPNLLEVTKINNRWAIVLNYIEGTPLSKLMEEHPENMDEYLNRMADIHLDVLSRNVPSLSRIKDKYKRKITESTDLTDNIKYELLQRLEGMHNHNKLCHGDFSPSNILILEDGSYAMLDWAHATQGNASADVAKTYLTFATHGQQDLADKYIDIFCEKSGVEKTLIQKWIPIVAAAYLDQQSEEKELLKKWSDIVD